MKTLTIHEINEAIGAQLTQGDDGLRCSKVSTDTRSVLPGDLFFALVGEKFDAHDFIEQAVVKGAGALVVSRPVSVRTDIPVLLVKDTLAALQALAGYNRQHYKIPVIGVTGSNGKTTTKDMIAAVLEQRYKTLKTQANFNNHIGLPLTLLQLDETYQGVVVEMGMRGLGEIDLLAAIAKPTVAVITNIGETHLERLGSVENIAKAKGEILNHMAQDGFALLHGDNPWVSKAAGDFPGRKIFYGLEQGNQLRAIEIHAEAKGTRFICQWAGGQADIYIPVPGRHNILNALAAVGVGLELGLTGEQIKEGLAGLNLTGMRLEVIETPVIRIINDAYNANPASMKEALRVLRDLARDRRAIAVLGNMYELGERAVAGHREVGAEAAQTGVQVLVTVGDLAGEIAEGARLAGLKPEKVFPCRNNQEGVEVIKNLISTGDVLLVKGSRGMKMEEIVKALVDEDLQQLQEER